MTYETITVQKLTGGCGAEVPIGPEGGSCARCPTVYDAAGWIVPPLPAVPS